MTARSSNRKRSNSASVSFEKLQRSFADASATPLTVGAANAPGASSPFATIDAGTLTSEEIIVVVVAFSTTVTTTTVGPPTERQNATVVIARSAMGIALATISLVSESPRLAAIKTARVS